MFEIFVAVEIIIIVNTTFYYTVKKLLFQLLRQCIVDNLVAWSLNLKQQQKI